MSWAPPALPRWRMLLLAVILGIAGVIYLSRAFRPSYALRPLSNLRAIISNDFYPAPDLHRRLCDNSITASIDRKVLAQKLNARVKWAFGDTIKNANKKDNLEPRSSKLTTYIRPVDIFAKSAAWSFEKLDHTRYQLMGPVAVPCHTRTFAEGFEDVKLACDNEKLAASVDCVVVSIGSGGLFNFETALFSSTRCRTYVFDCTLANTYGGARCPTCGQVPSEIAPRTKFIPMCVAATDFVDEEKRVFASYGAMLREAGVRTAATVLKIDIEGGEWSVLPQVLHHAAHVLRETGEDIYPEQILLEVHFVTTLEYLPWHGRDKTAGEVFLFFNELLLEHGYALAHVQHNEKCRTCTEVVLVRALCPV